MRHRATALQLAASIIRLGGVAGKFVVIALLAGRGSIEDIGRFTLLYTLVNVAVFVIGGELHLGTLRLASVQSGFGDRCRIAANNLRFDVGAYTLLLTAGLLGRWAVPADAVGNLDLLWLALLIAADHAVQQLSRWHIFFGSPVIGNIVQGIKAGLWGWIFVPVSMLGVPPTSQHIAETWLACNLVALGIAWYAMHRLRSTASLSMPFKLWLSRASQISRTYYLTGLANNLASNFDRLLVGSAMGIAELGRYGFWVSLASGIPLFLTSFVGARHFSDLLTSIGQGRLDDFDRRYRKFLSDYLRLAAGSLMVFMLLAPLVPPLLNKPTVDMALPVVLGICGSITIGALWQVPYQALFSAADDSWLMWSQLGYMLITLAGNIAGAYWLGIPGLCLASSITGLSLFLLLNARLQRIIRARRSVGPDHSTI